MNTIADIAKKAEVSKSTVSKVINNYSGVSSKTRERVHRVMRECNYFPNTTARCLITHRSKLIGLFLASQLNDPFFREVIDGIEKTLGPRGYDILYLYTPAHLPNGQPIGYVEKVKTRHVDGVIILGFLNQVAEFDCLLESDIPTVFVDMDLQGPKASYVISDNFSSGYRAVDHLIKLGHKRIGLIDGLDISTPAEQRLKGFQQALAEGNLEYNPDWTFRGEFLEREGYQAMEAILQMPEQPTALVAQDSMAMGVIEALKGHGKSVPKDLSIVGLDDMEFCRYCGLTTVRQEKDAMGEAASELLLQIIGDEPFLPRIIETTLIERGSCLRWVEGVNGVLK